jgi:hypothetical protein
VADGSAAGWRWELSARRWRTEETGAALEREGCRVGQRPARIWDDGGGRRGAGMRAAAGEVLG